MNKIFKNKRGVTLLEGLIALVLLALVATGTFSVLLSTSRKSTTPDIQEEMSLAVEQAYKLLQAYMSDPSASGGLCGGDDNPLSEDTGSNNNWHVVNCLLPKICDQRSPKYSKMGYMIREGYLLQTETNTSYTLIPKTNNDTNQRIKESDSSEVSSGLKNVAGSRGAKEIKFSVLCNGFSL